MGALGWVSLSLFSLISAAYRSVSPNLSPVSDWQTLTFSFASEDRFLLVSLRSKRGGRTLLTADFAENETADWSEETRLWTVRAEFSDVEGWAHNVSETAVQVPARGKDVYVSVYIDAWGVGEHELTGVFHDGFLCPQNCSKHGLCFAAYCQCEGGWAGPSCSFPVAITRPDVIYQLDLWSGPTVLQCFDGFLQEIEVQMMDGDTPAKLCLLEAPNGYLIPSQDYCSLCKNLPGRGDVAKFKLTHNLPVYISVSGNYTAALMLSTHANSPAASAQTFILVGVLIPSCLIIVGVVVLILYFRVCRGGLEEPSLPAPVVLSLPPPRGSKVPLDLDAVSSATRYLEVSLRYSSDCPVCLDGFEPDSIVRQLPCGHVYHSPCLELLAVKQQICSICRSDFDTRRLEASMLTTQGDAHD